MPEGLDVQLARIEGVVAALDARFAGWRDTADARRQRDEREAHAAAQLLGQSVEHVRSLIPPLERALSTVNETQQAALRDMQAATAKRLDEDDREIEAQRARIDAIEQFRSRLTGMAAGVAVMLSGMTGLVIYLVTH